MKESDDFLYGDNEMAEGRDEDIYDEFQMDLDRRPSGRGHSAGGQFFQVRPMIGRNHYFMKDAGADSFWYGRWV